MDDGLRTGSRSRLLGLNVDVDLVNHCVVNVDRLGRHSRKDEQGSDCARLEIVRAVRFEVEGWG